MAKNEYYFITHWKVEGDVQKVSDIPEDVPSLARWWPPVYFDVNILEPGDEHGWVGWSVCIPRAGFLTDCAGSHGLPSPEVAMTLHLKPGGPMVSVL